jgi:hypothetical protein
MTFYRIIKEKFDEKERMASQDVREEIDFEGITRMGSDRDRPIRRMHF